ncbi:MAG TPA: 7-cyano-7-deazaguanine synthase QueC [Stellaceae bacterium]|nr:7-cyano-7-deazaguanine synthase QueC [Stellaceae bacterium]
MSQVIQPEAALVLFSGGQDSTTCLVWALARFASVETIGFDYGQRHRVELDCRERIAARLRAEFPHWGEKLGPDHLIDLTVLGRISDTALTRDSAIQFAASGLPNTFVPGRNLLFFTFAAATGYRRGLKHLVGGMCETDYSGYPVCRDDTLKALQATLTLGLDQRYVIHTPLMWRDKAATWTLARELGGATLVELIREETHSCYAGDRSHRYAWGCGCGACPACDLRRKGWEAFARASEF